MLDLNSVAKPSANEINNEHKKLQFTKFLVSIGFHFPLGMPGFPRAQVAPLLTSSVRSLQGNLRPRHTIGPDILTKG